MKFIFGKESVGFFISAAIVGATSAFLFTHYTYRQAFPNGGAPFTETIALRISAVVCFFVLLGSVIWLLNQRFKRIEQTQNWLLDAINWNIDLLKANGLSGLPDTGENLTSVKEQARWPWGNHHTEYLGHLDAAARKWWNLYDPGDPTTAPTNEMVSDWLQSERNLSRERARAIASMLRPDGLPTGPRR